MKPVTLVIEGMTDDGELFRPSDWIDRLLETLSTYGNDRRSGSRQYRGVERRSGQIRFLQAQICDGRKCIVVDLRLQEANPEAFEFLMAFVRSNRLRCREVS